MEVKEVKSFIKEELGRLLCWNAVWNAMDDGSLSLVDDRQCNALIYFFSSLELIAHFLKCGYWPSLSVNHAITVLWSIYAYSRRVLVGLPKKSVVEISHLNVSRNGGLHSGAAYFGFRDSESPSQDI